MLFRKKKQTEPQAEQIKPVKVEGLDWTPDALLIAVLVKRLGGSVEITYKEIAEVQNLIIKTEDDIRVLKIKVITK